VTRGDVISASLSVNGVFRLCLAGVIDSITYPPFPVPSEIKAASDSGGQDLLLA
jgi:hypothetical protein